jgi:hypothetical protein
MGRHEARTRELGEFAFGSFGLNLQSKWARVLNVTRHACLTRRSRADPHEE